MNASKVNAIDNKNKDNSKSLRGTLFSVMMVGAFIGSLFVAIFWLYMSRV